MKKNSSNYKWKLSLIKSNYDKLKELINLKIIMKHNEIWKWTNELINNNDKLILILELKYYI